MNNLTELSRADCRRAEADGESERVHAQGHLLVFFPLMTSAQCVPHVTTVVPDMFEHFINGEQCDGMQTYHETHPTPDAARIFHLKVTRQHLANGAEMLHAGDSYGVGRSLYLAGLEADGCLVSLEDFNVPKPHLSGAAQRVVTAVRLFSSSFACACATCIFS